VSTKKKLTSISAEAMKPKRQRYEVADAGSALRLLVLPSGHKSFILRYRRPDGRTAKLTLGRFDPSAEMTDAPVLGAPMTLGAARQLAASCQREIARGNDPAGLNEKATVEAAKAVTLADVLPAYVAHLKANNRTHAATERALRSLVKPWRERPLASITSDNCSTLVDRARTQGLGLEVRRQGPSESRARLAHSLLGGLFSWCVKKRKLERSPMAGLEAPKAIVARERVLDDDEIAILWRAVDILSPWHAGCVKLLLLSGQRLREITELRHDEIQGDTIALDGTRTKNKRSHTVPLSPLARGVLDAVPTVEGSPFVFSLGTAPIGGWYRVKHRLDAEMRKLGWSGKPWRVHDLRRTCATGLARLGVAVHVTERVLNHASGTISGIAAIYNRHSYAKECREALETWAIEIAKITGENVVDFAQRRAAG
jgi:integrase